MLRLRTSSPKPTPNSDDRWRFLRDVAVFQLKMAVGNLRDFALMPVSLGAALVDLIFKGKREGAFFYSVLEWGAHSEKMIDAYSAIEHGRAESDATDPQFTIDAAVARLEAVVIREYEKGGAAADVRSAMDRKLDLLHRGTGAAQEKVTAIVTRVAGKIGREKAGTQPKD
jgi:hypothetical protein